VPPDVKKRKEKKGSGEKGKKKKMKFKRRSASFYPSLLQARDEKKREGGYSKKGEGA